MLLSVMVMFHPYRRQIIAMQCFCYGSKNNNYYYATRIIGQFIDSFKCVYGPRVLNSLYRKLNEKGRENVS